MKYTTAHPPIQCFMRQSTWYKGAPATTVQGVLIHSTGSNNPYIKRYVQPDDNAPDREKLLEIIGVNKNGNDWNHIQREAGVNAFIGKLASGEVSSVQVGPWDKKAWGCGSGPKGSCNNGWIQFEICEDGLTDPVYFKKIYQEAVELASYLCQLYGLDPLGTVTYSGVKCPAILCHQDSYRLGLGSNHGDVLHWFPKQGKTMDDFRADVAGLLRNSQSPEPEKPEGGDEEMTYEQWKEYMERYRRELGSKDPAPWAVPYIDKCVDAGIVASVNGTMERPGDLLTRQEGAKMAAQTLEAAKK